MGRWFSKAVAVAMGCAMALMLSCGVAWADDAAAVETGEYANASIEISESNFPDAALRAILMRYDVNANDALDLGEVEHLVIESSDVKSLEGVGGIPGLQSLEVQSSPRIVEIRLGECTDLTTLVVTDCANLSKIDLSGCVVLESISCDGNALRDVVFPADPSPIVSLSCAGNAIESLDLSLFASLQLLNCENNLLKQITFPAQTIGNLSFAIQRGTDKGKELRGWSFSQGGLPDAVDLTDEGIGPEDYASFVAGRSVFAVWQNRDFSDGTWVYADGGRRYQLSDGTFLSAMFATLGGKTFYFDEEGYAQVGWQKISDAWCYFDADGAMATGWVKPGKVWYYLDPADGSMATGWVKPGKVWYYLDPSSGAMQTGWEKVSGKWYYLASNGAMQTGWFKPGKVWYYLTSSGAMATGWEKVSGKWYWMDSSGAMQTGWIKPGSVWYYLTSSGAMATGWEKVSGKWYYLDTSSGAMQKGWVKPGSVWYHLSASGAMDAGWYKGGNYWYYLLPSSGAMQTGWEKVSGKWYYLDPSSGAMQKGWIELGDTWYYLTSSGAMATGWIKPGSAWYYLTSSGAMATGWEKVSGKWYYLDPSSGAMQKGWVKPGSTWYYLTSSGAMATGWVNWADNKWSYLRSNGAMVTGKYTVYGVTYNFGTSGTISDATYGASKVLGVPRNDLVDWLSSHQSYYLGTKYSSGFSVSTCMYPKGAPRSDGFVGMNCTGFVAHAYRSVGGNLGPIAKTNSHSPWSGGPGGGSYINAWRWYGYAIDSGAKVYTYNSVSSMLKSGKAQKGDIIFFKTNGFIDCHIGFFWGDVSNQNKMWHQILQGNLISTCYNNANKSEYNQKCVLIKGQ